MIETVKQIVAQNLAVSSAHEMVPQEQQLNFEEMSDLSDKLNVITDGSEGTRYGVPHTLLSRKMVKWFILFVCEDIVNRSLEAI